MSDKTMMAKFYERYQAQSGVGATWLNADELEIRLDFTYWLARQLEEYEIEFQKISQTVVEP